MKNDMPLLDPDTSLSVEWSKLVVTSLQNLFLSPSTTKLGEVVSLHLRVIIRQFRTVVRPEASPTLTMALKAGEPVAMAAEPSRTLLAFADTVIE